MLSRLICLFFGHDIEFVTNQDGVCRRCPATFWSSPAYPQQKDA